MLPYIIVFTIFFAFAVLEAINVQHRVRKWIFIASIAVMVIFMGLRWETGTDWSNYLSAFNNADDAESFFPKWGGMEKGYLWTNFLIRKITSSYQVFLLLHALFFYTLIFSLFKKVTPYPQAAILVFFGAFMGITGANRQLIALAIACSAVPLIFSGKKIYFLMRVAVAFLFHQSVVLTALFLALNRNFKAVTLYLSVGIAILVSYTSLISTLLKKMALMVGGLMGDKIIYYLKWSETHGEIELGFAGIAKRLLFMTVFIMLRPKLILHVKYYNLILNIYVFGIVMYFALGSTFTSFSSRGSIYFNIFESALITMPMILMARVSNKLVYLICLLILSVAFFFTSISLYPDLFLPYKGLFFNRSFIRQLY